MFRKNKNKNRSKRGFSLVELIVAIGILAVLTAVLAPTLSSNVERSRAQRDASAMDEIVRVVQKAVSQSTGYDEMLLYSCDNNYVTYTDSSGNYGQQEKSNEFWAPDGLGKATTITFNPKSGALWSTYEIEDAIVNDMTFGNGSSGENRVMVGMYAQNGQCYLRSTAVNSDATTAYVYHAIRSALGESITVRSNKYKNSSFTVFITWDFAGGVYVPRVYGYYNGINLSKNSSASVGSGTNDYDNAGDPITRPDNQGGINNKPTYNDSTLIPPTITPGVPNPTPDYKQ